LDKLIFIVDDTDSILTLSASILEDDFRVLTMPSAAKMFSLLERKQPDMIIMDVEMPEMNGFEALAVLKENPAWNSIPVMFLTGYIDDAVLSRVAELGALSVFNKSEISTGLLEHVMGSFDAIG